MKKLLFLLLLSIAHYSPSNNEPTNTDSSKVYICDSKNGKKYHYLKSCRGLSSCKAKIKEITVESAEKLGKTICGWED